VGGTVTPGPSPGALTVGRWEPASLADLTADRRQPAAALHDGARPSCADEHAVERLLLAYDELTPNALRPGRGGRHHHRHLLAPQGQ
jgi:hypothetical protein